jgi:hypothetical protein
MGRKALENIFQELIKGITALPAALVRPRWQPEPLPMPEPGVNWAAFGIIRAETRSFPAVRHMPEGEGKDRLTAWRDLELLISFYGPEGADLAEVMLDGLRIEQNRRLLRQNHLAFVRAEALIHVPELRAASWLPRTDLSMHFTKTDSRDYAVPSLLSADVGIKTDKGLSVSGVPCGP